MIVGDSMSQIQKTKRQSILHVQNVFLVNSIGFHYAKETERYIIGYEPKLYRYHSLVIKIDKKLVSEISSEIEIKGQVDINVKEDFRLKIKSIDKEYFNGIRTIMRIVPSRYMSTYNPLYGMIFHFNWRHTGAGGRDFLEFEIQECPIIVNASTISNICYKHIDSQVSGGGTHGLQTYIILSPEKGQFKIGEHVKISNINKSGHQHMYIKPVVINL